MKVVAALVLSAVLVILIGSASWAYNCPVVIKQAEDTIKKAEAGKVSPETAMRCARPRPPSPTPKRP
jgi:hypothetical protein